MTKLNVLFNPNFIKNVFDENRRIKIEVATGLDTVTICYMDRRFDYYVIDFKIGGDPRNCKTEETKAKFTLANDIDEVTIHHIITDDEYVVWNALDKAFSADHLAPTHDIDGFLQLISYNDYRIKKKHGYWKYRNCVLPDGVVRVYHAEEQTTSASEFADAIALQVQILSDRVTVTHHYSGEFREPAIFDVYGIMDMIPEIKKIIDNDRIVSKIVTSYNKIFDTDGMMSERQVEYLFDQEF